MSGSGRPLAFMVGLAWSCAAATSIKQAKMKRKKSAFVNDENKKGISHQVFKSIVLSLSFL
jgi:hypothetical protein